MIWAFVTLLLLTDGEAREIRSPDFASWQSCEYARIAALRSPMPDELQARVLGICRQVFRQ